MAAEDKLIALRMDDVGASSKAFEVYGRTKIHIGGLEIPFPGNFLFFKYMKPFKKWAPYKELNADVWAEILDFLVSDHLKLTIGITAGWVEKDASIIPFPEKFPKSAEMIKKGVKHELLEVASHGYTHCVLKERAFLPRALSGNRLMHREFWDWIPLDVQEEHISKSKKILEDFFEEKIVTFVPPGNVFTKDTLALAKRYGFKYISCRGAHVSPDQPLIPIPENQVFDFHDKEIAEGGINWLKEALEIQKGSHRVCFVKDLGQRIEVGSHL